MGRVLLQVGAVTAGAAVLGLLARARLPRAAVLALAGVTTLAHLLYPAMDLALVRDWNRPHLRRWPTVLVTRGTASALNWTCSPT